MNIKKTHKYRSVLLLLSLALNCFYCGDMAPTTEPGRGIQFARESDKDLIISLNAGILTENAAFNRQARKAIRSIENQTFLMKGNRVNVKLIVDQPQNAPYITGRVMGRRQASWPDRLNFNSLEKRPGFIPGIKFKNDRDRMHRYIKYTSHSVLAARSMNSQILQQINESENPQMYLLSYWHAYFQAQVHYDIVFTEYFFLEDRIDYLKPAELYSVALMPAPGRSALEQMGVLVGPYKTGEQMSNLAIEENLNRAVTMLLPDRYDIYRALAFFHAGKKKESCRSLKITSHPSESQQSVSNGAAISFLANHCSDYTDI